MRGDRERSPLSGDPARRSHVATAGFALALGLFAAALPWPPPAAPVCALPAEDAARAGHTLEVRCDGEGGALRGPARLLFGLGVDPNRADARTLEVLPGIGPARAAAIVAERQRRPFAHAADLERVAGIGPVTRRRMAPWLSLPGEARPERNR